MRLRLRTVVSALLLSTIIPLANAASHMVSESWNQQLVVVNRQNVETARAIGLAIDQLVENTTTVLTKAAASDVLDDPAVPAQEWAAGLLQYQPHWRGLEVRLPSGEVRLDAGMPMDNDTDAPDWASQVRASGQPLVSDLMGDKPDFFVVVAVPVTRNNQVQAVLAARMDVSQFGEILRRQNPGGDTVIGLTDRAGRTMARSRGEEQFVGTLASRGLLDAREVSPEGNFRGNNREGVPSYSAFSRSPTTGWSIGIGLPAETLESPIRQTVKTLNTFQVLMLVLGIGSALVLGRAFTKAVGSMQLATVALVKGDAVKVRPSRIKEVAELTESLEQAGRVMNSRLSDQMEAQAERNRAREEQELLFVAERAARRGSEARLESSGIATDGVIAIGLDATVKLLNHTAQTLTGWREADAIGQPFKQTFHFIHKTSRHPLDVLGLVRQEGQSVMFPDDVVLVAKGGREVTVQGSAAPLRQADGTLLGTLLVFRSA